MCADERRPDESAPTRSTGRRGARPPSFDVSIPGARLGDFELLSELGRGGMGIVYEARQVSLDRRIALKVLPPALGLSESAVKRFGREARAAAKLHHTNIVPVHSIGEEGGCHYYAMELIDGPSLSTVLRDLSGGGSNPLMNEAVIKLGSDGGEPGASDVEARSIDPDASSLSEATSSGRAWFDAGGDADRRGGLGAGLCARQRGDPPGHQNRATSCSRVPDGCASATSAWPGSPRSRA